MAHLVIHTPEGRATVRLQDLNTLGRHPSNTIQLLDKIVSKQHCVVERRRDGYVLRDLGSMNGTCVNGRRLSGEHLLRHADEIVIGGSRVFFEAERVEAEEEPDERVELEDGCVGAVSQR